MKALISESLISVLSQQISEERYNSNLYLCIFSYLEAKGLRNLANIFMEQSREENEHSEKIAVFLAYMGARFDVPDIGGCNSGFSGLIQIGKMFLDREVATSTSLAEIKDMAIEEKSPVAEEFLRHMIGLQSREYEEAGDFLAKAILLEDDWKFISLWDIELGS